MKCSIPPDAAVEFFQINNKFLRKKMTLEEMNLIEVDKHL